MENIRIKTTFELPTKKVVANVLATEESVCIGLLKTAPTTITSRADAATPEHAYGDVCLSRLTDFLAANHDTCEK